MQNPNAKPHIRFSPVTRNIGAEISADGFVSLIEDSTSHEVQQIANELYQALVQYKVIFIRNGGSK